MTRSSSRQVSDMAIAVSTRHLSVGGEAQAVNCARGLSPPPPAGGSTFSSSSERGCDFRPEAKDDDEGNRRAQRRRITQEPGHCCSPRSVGKAACSCFVLSSSGL